ncbi:MAG TPA: hypothetical protein VFC07_07985 [Verrucomicrobiae bacterium]|nr:hypothetical protein [Verrucomicrobiae bacterium]
MRRIKFCFVLAMFIAAANFSRAAGPSQAPATAAQPAPISMPPNLAAQTAEEDAERMHQRKLLLGLIAVLLAVAGVYQFSRRGKHSIVRH